MKIAYFNGGLGNQAFQYIFQRFVELKSGETCYLDDSFFFYHERQHNGYEIERVFPYSKPNLLSRYFTMDVWEYMIENCQKGKYVPQQMLELGVPLFMVFECGEHHFDGNLVKIPANQFTPDIAMTQGDVYYHGYWINKHWLETYRETLLKELRFPELQDARNQEYTKRIRLSNSVCVHIRRTDFITLGWSVPMKWYADSVKKMKSVVKKPTFFIFSDEIEWCKENLSTIGFETGDKIEFVEGNYDHEHNYIDLQLMSQCKHMIISNSSFSYLAALLNNNENRYTANPTSREV